MVFARVAYLTDVSFFYRQEMECGGCFRCCSTESPPPKLEPTSAEVIDSALVVRTLRNTVGDFQRNLKFVTRLEHQISIPKLATEIYCISPSHSVQVSDEGIIKLIFEKCAKCKFCIEVNAVQLSNVPSTVNVSMRDINPRDSYVDMN